MSSTYPTTQKPPKRNGEQPSPPAQWLWDFPLETEAASASCKADGTTKVRVAEYWSYENAEALRRVKAYAQDEIVQRLKDPIPLRGGSLPSTGLQIALVLYETGIVPPLGMSLLNEMNEALGLPNYHHHYCSTMYGAVGIFELPDDNWGILSPSCYLLS